eukprot:scaffold8825_cov58-Phaeocystis_antarctica.AAC.2
MSASAEERAASSTRAAHTHQQRRHALHYLLVLDQHADRCALAAYARRHVGDTTISNRVRPAAHHDATVHLVPRCWPEAMMEALVVDDPRSARPSDK